jgi:hypothetical protein
MSLSIEACTKIQTLTDQIHRSPHLRERQNRIAIAQIALLGGELATEQGIDNALEIEYMTDCSVWAIEASHHDGQQTHTRPA